MVAMTVTLSCRTMSCNILTTSYARTLSKPVVGSSTKRIEGDDKSSTPIDNLFFSPPDIPFVIPGSPTYVSFCFWVSMFLVDFIFKKKYYTIVIK